jgi:hypothetical protein
MWHANFIGNSAHLRQGPAKQNDRLTISSEAARQRAAQAVTRAGYHNHLPHVSLLSN